MLCEKCGKNNSDSVTVCKHCGALLPLKESCGGFSDILSYEIKKDAVGRTQNFSDTKQSEMSEETLRNLRALEQDLNTKFRQCRKKAKSAALVATLSLLVGAAAILLSVVYNPYAGKIAQMEKQISEMQTILSSTEFGATMHADVPEGNLESELNSLYSKSSEKVKQSAENWKKAQEVPPVPVDTGAPEAHEGVPIAPETGTAEPQN